VGTHVYFGPPGRRPKLSGAWNEGLQDRDQSSRLVKDDKKNVRGRKSASGKGRRGSRGRTLRRHIAKHIDHLHTRFSEPSVDLFFQQRDFGFESSKDFDLMHFVFLSGN
jgi:hypothetical protein